MDPLITFALYAALLVTVSMIGAYVPRFRTLGDSQTHLLISFSAGVFLGLLFLMLLPEAIEEAHGHGGYDLPLVMGAVLVGFLAMMSIETYMKHKHMACCSCECGEDRHSHKLTSTSSFIGLSVHAICDGMALAATFLAGEEVGLLATVGMCVHKFVVLMSLSSTMLLTDMRKKECMKRLFAFAMITPIAGLAFFFLLNGIDLEGLTGLPLAFAAGTFMYVSLCNMLPEAFHRKKQDSKSFYLLILGILVILVMTLLFPHSHAH